MTTTRTEPILHDDRLAPLLPMIEQAWADGGPTELEMAAICMALLRHSGADHSCSHSLHRWLDLEQPPSPEDLAALASRMASLRAAAAQAT